MQTFVPYASMYESAECLDRQRLGKQRVECLQILKCLAGESTGWRNHPAVRMWAGHERALVRYTLTVCAAWRRRGYRDTCGDQALALAARHGWAAQVLEAPMPPWWGRPDLHRSHRSNLLRKEPDHYGPLWGFEPDDLPYVWPDEVVNGHTTN